MSRSACDVVRTTMGMRRSSVSSLISSRTSRPPFRGKLRSSRIKSGRGADAYLPRRRRNASASTPSCATCRLLRTLTSRSASRVSRTSPGLSSTRSTWIGVESLTSAPPLDGQGERGRRARSRSGCDPDFAAMALDNLLGERETDARAPKLLLSVELLKNHEDAIVVLRLDANAVVSDAENPAAVLLRRRDVDARWLRGPELDGIGHQVLKDVFELARVRQHGRQRIVGQDGARLLDGESDIGKRAVEDDIGVGSDEGAAAGAHP